MAAIGLWFVLACFVLGSAYAQNFYVVAPSTFRLNADETIAVAIEGDRGAMVHVYIQDHPGKIKNISQTVLPVHPDQPELFKIRLDPAEFPPNFLTEPGSPKLVSVTAKTDSDTFTKEILVPISDQTGYVFMLTDKPIYTPKENANFRIISLGEDGLPSEDPFKLHIKNPKGIIVEEKIFKRDSKEQKKMVMIHHNYKFPTYPILGDWSATVLYGYKLQQNTTVFFELQEYVLPTFTLKLETQEVILPSAHAITVDVTAQHVYGKKVQGVVTFRLGVKSADSPNAVYFAVVGPKELVDGFFNLRVKTQDLKNHKDIGWFPEIEGSRLVVEATVVDDATGNKESVVDATGRFSTTPFVISFTRCLTDFKPGLMSVFEADITYVDGKPASEISTKIRATADGGKPLNIEQDTAVSDENGKVAFTIQPEMQHTTIAITLETIEPGYEGSQAKGNFEQRKYESKNGTYIALARSTGQRLKANDVFSKMIDFEPAGIKDIYYLLLAKGRILSMKKLPPGEFKNQQIQFQITHDMVPSFRVVVFAHFGDEFIADSLKIDVERECHPNAQVSITPEFQFKEPGYPGKIIIRGSSGTVVGLLGVDEAVYALSKKDLLTKAKVFDKLASHDLGCGPGGGLTINSVLGNAGITIGTNKFTPSLSHTCVEIKRKKREAASDIVSTYDGPERECCALGIQKDLYNRNCQERTNIVVRQLQGEYYNCSKAFLDCCIFAGENGITDIKMIRPVLGRAAGENVDHLDYISIDDEKEMEGFLNVRSNFKENWIFHHYTIGPDNKEEKDFSLPHSITTWVLQAVTVSPTHGICVVEPQKLVSFKKIFLHLNLPYSVVRNEQVEIQATVFNYGNRKIAAIVYMYGAKDLCTGTQAGEKSDRKRLLIDGQSAKSVSFPVIPLKAENFVIKVVVLSSEGSDAIEKTLHVVPEGVTKEIDVPIKLDPSNQQRRPKRHVQTKQFTDSIDPSQNLQVTAIKLNVPENFVPGTASCSITALGDQFGPVVETAINNPEALVQLPRGCGEQNMVYLAPTLYTMRYLKVTGKITAAMEDTGYQFIRIGYGNQLAFRKDDGSYSAFTHRPTSAWLTAFVMKVFCQANELVRIDQNVICSGVKWLINNQEPDGSYIESYPVYAVDLMGGVDGKHKAPMTAFTLIALEECDCDAENLLLAKQRAVAYLEDHLEDVETPLPVAIVAYALALSDSELKHVANDKLLSMAQTDQDLNMMYWETQNSAQDIETAGYALLTQLLFGDMDKGAAIVNWLNTKQLQSGSYKSTQDTVVALQGMSEYYIRSQVPSINLVSNISSSNDRNFHKVLTFNRENAFILRDVKVDKIGGTLFINTAGHGVGSLAVKLRYNIIVPAEKICKFDVTINLTDSKDEKEIKEERISKLNPAFDPRSKDMFDSFPPDLIRGLVKALEEDGPGFVINPRNRPQQRVSLVPVPVSQENVTAVVRSKRQSNVENSKIKYRLKICVRYLGNKETEMSIVDVGIFSGFEPVVEDLIELQENPDHLIQRYEKSSRGVVFYLQKVPITENYCFSFHVVREFLVGNTQMSVVKVYEYYNPDETCTKFYSPASNSPMLRTICEGGICVCAEGGCPKTSIPELKEMSGRSKRREELENIACENYDYVWKGKLSGNLRKEGGFLNISFHIVEVVKEGIEPIADIEGDTRTLLTRDNCPELFPGNVYLIMGKDGAKYMNSNGETWYRYMLDQTSLVHMWTEPKFARDKELQRDLNYVTKRLKDKGCPK